MPHAQPASEDLMTRLASIGAAVRMQELMTECEVIYQHFPDLANGHREAAAPPPAPRTPRPPKKKPAAPLPSLRTLVAEVISSSTTPLSNADILAAVQRAGWSSSAKSPIGVVGTATWTLAREGRAKKVGGGADARYTAAN